MVESGFWLLEKTAKYTQSGADEWQTTGARRAGRPRGKSNFENGGTNFTRSRIMWAFFSSITSSPPQKKKLRVEGNAYEPTVHRINYDAVALSAVFLALK